MGLLNKILKGGKKVIKSDAGKILAPIAIGYAKKQSADVRKYAAVAEPIYAVIQATKTAPNDVLVDTIYSRTGVTMPIEMPQIAPIKRGTTTSTFKISAIAALLSPMIPILYKVAENGIGTLPPNSWLAFVMPGVLASIYGFCRFLTTNGERQATAQVATAAAVIATTQAEAIEWQAPMPATMYTAPDDDVTDLDPNNAG